MDSLYSKIRYKLGDMLHAWYANVASAYAILSPWKTVFDPASWKHLIVYYTESNDISIGNCNRPN